METHSLRFNSPQVDVPLDDGRNENDKPTMDIGIDTDMMMITFRSSDLVTFEIHKRNLEMHSNMLSLYPCTTTSTSSDTTSSDTTKDPNSKAKADGDHESPNHPHPNPIPNSNTNTIIALTEPSAVLTLLFQFMRNEPQPDLSALPFSTLAGLTAAVEKYKVYAAMESCKSRLRECAAQHPLRVLHIAATYKYTTLMDEAAPHTIGLPLRDVQATLKPAVFNAWIRYHRTYLDLLPSLYTYVEPTRWHWEGLKDKGGVKTMDSPCEVWTEVYAKVAFRFAAKPDNLVGGRVGEVFRYAKEVIGLRCMSCPRWVADWESEVLWRVGRLKGFSAYL